VVLLGLVIYSIARTATLTPRSAVRAERLAGGFMVAVPVALFDGLILDN